MQYSDDKLCDGYGWDNKELTLQLVFRLLGWNEQKLYHRNAPKTSLNSIPLNNTQINSDPWLFSHCFLFCEVNNFFLKHCVKL